MSRAISPAAKAGQRSIAQQVATLTIGARADRARRAAILVRAAIEPQRAEGDDQAIVDEVTLDPEVVQAILDALNEAAMDCFWISNLAGLSGEAALNTPAPSDDERILINQLAAKGGGR